MKGASKKRTPDKGEKQIERVRRICLALPETWEKISHGEPTWFVKKRVFAMFSNNHHNDGHIAVTIPAAIGIQEMLIKKSPKKFYRPPYVGVAGWVGIELDRISDEELALHLREAWRLIAPESLQVTLGAAPGESECQESRQQKRERHVLPFKKEKR